MSENGTGPSIDLPVDIQREQVSEEDLVIAVFGVTGSGKSNFIDRATRRTGRAARASLDLFSATKTISATKIRHKGRSIVLLDLPGFSHTSLPVATILEEAAKWLGWGTQDEHKLCGAIWCHPITDTHMSSSHLQNLTMLHAICEGFRPLVLMTTFWDRGEKGEKVFEQRERQLHEIFWDNMLNKSWGAKSARFNNTTEAAYSVIDAVIDGADEARNNPYYSSIPQASRYKSAVEMDQHRYLKITKAGKRSSDELQGRVREREAHKETLLSQIETAAMEGCEEAVQLLREKVKEIDKHIEMVKKEGHKLEVPLSRRIQLWFKRREL